MRKCPQCGYEDPPFWRPAKMYNLSGDIDICHIDDLIQNEPTLGKTLNENRDIVVEDAHYAYLLIKRSHWVRRTTKQLYHNIGIKAFNPPYEQSPHSPFRSHKK